MGAPQGPQDGVPQGPREGPSRVQGEGRLDRPNGVPICTTNRDILVTLDAIIAVPFCQLVLAGP